LENVISIREFEIFDCIVVLAESVGGAVTVPKNGSGCTISDTGTGLRPVTVTEAAPFTGKRFLRVKVSTP
jgi:hypothetical protein